MPDKFKFLFGLLRLICSFDNMRRDGLCDVLSSLLPVGNFGNARAGGISPDRLARAPTAGGHAMAYSVSVRQIGSAGTPSGKAVLHEADSEIEAFSIAAYEVDAHRSAKQRIAMVWNPAGQLMLAYTGRTRGRSDADQG